MSSGALQVDRMLSMRPSVLRRLSNNCRENVATRMLIVMLLWEEFRQVIS